MLVAWAVDDVLATDGGPVYDWVRGNPGWVLFIIGALAANLWVRLREASDERGRRYAENRPAGDDV